MELYGSYDVVVAGGGTSGVAAALAAARAGASTLLIEKLGTLGGQMNVSGPPSYTYSHLWNRHGEQCLAGIIEETHHRLEKEGHALPYPAPALRNDSVFVHVDPDWWGLLMFRLMTENNVQLLLHSPVVEVVKEGDAVRGVIVENTSGRMFVLAKVVIDCTGEGDVAARAGAPFEKISKQDMELEPPSISFTLDGVDWPRFIEYIKANAREFAGIRRGPQESDSQFEARLDRRVVEIRSINTAIDLLATGHFSFPKFTEQALAAGEYHPYGDLGFFLTPRPGGAIQAFFQHSSQVKQCDATDVRELTAGEIEARRQSELAIRAAQKYIPGFENAYLSRVTSYLRIRETRRIMGDYKLTYSDTLDARKFKDVIGKSVTGMGAHHVAAIRSVVLTPSPDGRTGIKDGGSFDLPYRILVPLKVENLLVAGKMVSTDRECYLRFLPETMVTGQAAGAAAALCAKRGITPRQLENQVEDLQKELIRQGVILTTKY